MIAQGVARFDDEIRAHKLLETARVSTQVKTTLLATAGHVYDFQRIEDAIKLLYQSDEYDNQDARETREQTDARPSAGTRRSSGTPPKGKGKGIKKAYAAAMDQDWDDSGSGDISPTASDDETYNGAHDAQEGESSEGDASALMQELAQTLTATAKKLKAMTLGRGWTRSPKTTSTGTTRPSSASAARSSSSTNAPRPAKGANDKSRDMAMLKQKHPCSVCGELGHCYNDKDDGGRPKCRLHAQGSGRQVHFTDAGSPPDPSGAACAQTLVTRTCEPIFIPYAPAMHATALSAS